MLDKKKEVSLKEWELFPTPIVVFDYRSKTGFLNIDMVKFGSLKIVINLNTKIKAESHSSF